MKKTLKQIIFAIAIMAVTLAAGFALTGFSFNLFENLSQNQMRILFAADVLLLAAVATGVWYFFDSKKARKKRARDFQQRKSRRINQQTKQLRDINEIINFSNYAA